MMAKTQVVICGCSPAAALDNKFERRLGREGFKLLNLAKPHASAFMVYWQARMAVVMQPKPIVVLMFPYWCHAEWIAEGTPAGDLHLDHMHSVDYADLPRIVKNMKDGIATSYDDEGLAKISGLAQYVTEHYRKNLTSENRRIRISEYNAIRHAAEVLLTRQQIRFINIAVGDATQSLGEVIIERLKRI